MTITQKLNFYATPPHNCNYIPAREAVTLFADPQFPINTRIYTALADCGFRRSGEHLYIPHCSNCVRCVPVRIPVNEFIMNRSHRRVWKRNNSLVIKKCQPDFNPEYFALYQRYLAVRHAGGGMDNPTESNYMDFLTSSWSDTCFYEMREKDRLICVAVVDLLDNALSAVYTFFDPDFAKNSPGKYTILYQIEEAKNLGLNWLYLGYWIKGCNKMEYKSEYRPMEYFINNEWCQHL